MTASRRRLLAAGASVAFKVKNVESGAAAEAVAAKVSAAATSGKSAMVQAAGGQLEVTAAPKFTAEIEVSVAADTADAAKGLGDKLKADTAAADLGAKLKAEGLKVRPYPSS